MQNYQFCQGLDLVEFKESIHLQHHTLPKRFDIHKSIKSELPVNQVNYIRSLKCIVLVENGIQKCDLCKKL